MSTNGVNAIEDAEMADCDAEKVVTMVDVLQEQQDFEDDANAVLGASDDKNCTYTKGYIKRQAIYACLTCREAKDDPSTRAGVCLACSLHCHENHELVELYTKRNFRCDCGSAAHPCQFNPDKPPNEHNKYNQNFDGVYCTCHRPYPDPEATEEEEMIQCIICEDWLHSSHLDAAVPANDQYTEMICKACMEKNEFLYDYSEFAVASDTTVDVTSTSILDSTSAVDASLTNGNVNDNAMAINNDAEDNVDKTNNEATVIEKKDELVEAENTMASTAENAESLKPDSETSESTTETKTESTIETEENKDTLDDQVKELEKLISSETPDEENKETAGNSDNTNETQDKIEPPCDSDDIADKPSENKEKPEEKSELTNEESTNKMQEDKADSDDSLSIQKDLDEQTKEAKILQTDELKVENKMECEENTNKDLDNKPNAVNEQELTESKTEESDKEVENKTEKRKLDEEQEEVSTVKKAKLTNCIRPTNNQRVKGATFWPGNFRQKLCTCRECLAMYKDLSVLFLTDLEDTVSAYERLGKEKADSAPSQYEKGLEALSTLDRIQQINALTEYNRMRDKLLDFLKSFKDRKEIVKEEDIKAFFAGMKPKREQDGVYFCR